MNTEGSAGRTFPSEDEKHVADRDDRLDQQDNPDPSRVAPRHERQDDQSDTMSRTPLRRSHQEMFAASSGGMPKMRAAGRGLASHWIPIAIIASARSAAIPSASQCITLSLSGQGRLASVAKDEPSAAFAARPERGRMSIPGGGPGVQVVAIPMTISTAASARGITCALSRGVNSGTVTSV
jgi:hypothetical protein